MNRHLLNRACQAAIVLLLICQMSFPAGAQEKKVINIIVFGAHPDDCDETAGGTAAKWVAAGCRVRFVSVTNGDAGHQSEGGGALAKRRRAEAQEAGRRIGVDYAQGYGVAAPRPLEMLEAGTESRPLRAQRA